MVPRTKKIRNMKPYNIVYYLGSVERERENCGLFDFTSVTSIEIEALCGWTFQQRTILNV